MFQVGHLFLLFDLDPSSHLSLITAIKASFKSHEKQKQAEQRKETNTSLEALAQSSL